jgi:hypothetical protein
MDLKKAIVEGHMVDVIDFEKLNKNRDLYSSGPVCIEVENNAGDKYILPYRDNLNTMEKPGVYPLSKNGELDLVVYPNKADKDTYQPEVIDFNNTKNIQEYIQKRDQVEKIQRNILVNPDNIFCPPINEEDTPEMKGLKQAIIAKHIDIDKYGDRFGENFLNDKRKMKDTKISLFLLKRMCKNLDMTAELIIKDANPNVPNPMNHVLHIDLTGSNGNSDESKDEDE